MFKLENKITFVYCVYLITKTLLHHTFKVVKARLAYDLTNINPIDDNFCTLASFPFSLFIFYFGII